MVIMVVSLLCDYALSLQEQTSSIQYSNALSNWGLLIEKNTFIIHINHN